MRRIAASTLKIAISAGLLYLALRKANFSDLVAHLDAGSAGWITLATAITFLQVFVSALRWREISTDCDAPLTIAQANRFSLIGSFFNQVLPSAIGGDAMRVWLVGRLHGWRAAGYSVFVDRAIGLIALAILILATLPWSYHLISDTRGWAALVVLDAVAMTAGAGYLLLGKLPWRWIRSWWGTQHFAACAKITNHALFNRRRGPWIAILSMLIHVLAVVIAWCLARAIAAPLPFGAALQLVPPVWLIVMLPVSIAGWGVRETSMGLAFSYAGLPASDGVNTALLIGAVYFIVGIFGGVVWIFSAEKAARAATPLAVPD
ncbi:MAG TPA: lysylphosphatidylglycerol synthase transmembrane domain-containing protein [Nitrobacter sp.]|nr:lysylphosphatidylglycerol synthase transmembrane domain-containing protein [Nitrobacter sp.]